MKNVKSVYSNLVNSFKLNKIQQPKTSTFVILKKALHRPQASLQKLPNTPISLFHYNKIQKLALRRLKHEPIEYIAQKYNFRGLMFDLQKPVMIPNSHSEEIFKKTLQLLEKREEPIHFLDANCGCGIFSVSLLKENPKAICVAIDKSMEALELTGKNFHKIVGKIPNAENGLELIQSGFSEFIKKNVHKFDVILASPPCIPSEDWEKLKKEKLYEDRKSLDGGQYGLDKIWEVIRSGAEDLKKGGYLIVEMKEGQPEYFKQYFEENGGVAHNLKVHEGNESTFMIFKKYTPKADKKVETEQQKVETKV